jgi:hypothetical protein
MGTAPPPFHPSVLTRCPDTGLWLRTAGDGPGTEIEGSTRAVEDDDGDADAT